MRPSIRLALLLGAQLLGACASHPKVQEVGVPPLPAPLDASYDWHVLLVAPFGALFKDVPFTMVDVLQFEERRSDDQTERPTAVHPECYQIGQAAPRFMTATPQEFLLCFRHDHLVRIEATVMVLAADAPKILSDACGLWQRNAAAAAAPPPNPSASTPGADGCHGRDAEIEFDAQLQRDPDAEADRAFLPFTMALDAPDPP